MGMYCIVSDPKVVTKDEDLTGSRPTHVFFNLRYFLMEYENSYGTLVVVPTSAHTNLLLYSPAEQCCGSV
jgi:hypothetical protein